MDKTIFGNALKGAYQDFEKEEKRKKFLKEHPWDASLGGLHKGEKMMGEKHKHIEDSKGYCKTCGKDMTRNKMTAMSYKEMKKLNKLYRHKKDSSEEAARGREAMAYEKSKEKLPF